MSLSNFSIEQLIPLYLGCGVLVVSYFFFKKNVRIALLLLFIGVLVLGYFAANLNHFLSHWDEQFHALVAKNMSRSPFSPMLYSDPALEYDYTNWTGNHIWVHKQPLFLWQIALSIKMFGVNELAVRIPSIFMHAIIPLFIYRIGKIILNKEIGFIAAFIFGVSYFPLELIVGRFSTDHNDVAFLFYLTGSFWAWFEYQRSKKLKYIIILGVFSGGAMLVKWLMGSLVYVIWGISGIIADKKTFFTNGSIIAMIKSSFISLILFIPWQIYIHLKFPRESKHELAYNGKHFFHAIEGHHGDKLYHFDEALNLLYGAGDLIPYILIGALIIIISKCNGMIQKVFILGSVVFVYVFFTIAATKMLSFTIIVMPFLHLGIAALIYYLIQWTCTKLRIIRIRYYLTAVVTLLMAYFSLNLSSFAKSHTNGIAKENNYWQTKTIERDFIVSLATILPNEQYVIFNTYTSQGANIPIMFYTDHIAYMEFPSEQQVEELIASKRKVAVFSMRTLPDYILNNKEILKITVPKKLK